MSFRSCVNANDVLRGSVPGRARFRRIKISQRASRGRIEARRDLETAEGSGGGGCSGKMDRAASPTIQRPHLGNYAGNRLRVGTPQRVAPNSTGRWFARSERTGSSTNVRDA